MTTEKKKKKLSMAVLRSLAEGETLTLHCESRAEAVGCSSLAYKCGVLSQPERRFSCRTDERDRRRLSITRVK